MSATKWSTPTAKGYVVIDNGAQILIVPRYRRWPIRESKSSTGLTVVAMVGFLDSKTGEAHINVINPKDDRVVKILYSGAPQLPKKFLTPTAQKLVEKMASTLRASAEMDYGIIWKGTLKAGSATNVRDGITYMLKPSFLTTHSLDELHATILTVIADASKKWGGWEPNNLRVHGHSGSKAMGLALDPGKGGHTISLNQTLLTGYDIAAVARVVAHELCHHYREETWPRNRSRYLDTAHDRVFAEALSKVDPLVTVENCRYFDEEANELPDGKMSLRLKGKIEFVWKPVKGRQTVIGAHPGNLAEMSKLIPGFSGDLPVHMTDADANKLTFREYINGGVLTFSQAIDVLAKGYPRFAWNEIRSKL